MALLEIVSSGKSAVLFANRGNIGTLTDIVAQQKNSLKIPTPSGGGGGDEIFFGVTAF